MSISQQYHKTVKISPKSHDFLHQESLSSAFRKAKKMIRLVSSHIRPMPRLEDFHRLINKIDSINELRFIFKTTPEGYLKNRAYYSIFIRKGERDKKFFNLATKSFKKCKKKNLAITQTYTDYINVAGKNREFKKANQALEEASKKNIALFESYK